MSVTACLVLIEDSKDPYWEHQARTYVSTLIAYVLETALPEERTLKSVIDLLALMDCVNEKREDNEFDRLMDALERENPDSFAAGRYKLIKNIKKAERMHESIRAIVGQKLDTLTYDGPVQMYTRPDKVDFASLGRKKTAVFLNVSDTDRSCDRLPSLR